MAMKYKILQYPEPLLRQVCKEIQFPLTEQTKANIRLLKDTFRHSFVNYKKKTLGLSAPQIGVSQRFLIIPHQINYHHYDLRILSAVVRKFQVYINPIITSFSNQKCFIQQNCLSVGDELYNVQRSSSIQIQYFDQKGQKHKRQLFEMKARVFLHQYDHLDGILMFDKGSNVNKGEKNHVSTKNLKIEKLLQKENL